MIIRAITHTLIMAITAGRGLIAGPGTAAHGIGVGADRGPVGTEDGTVIGTEDGSVMLVAGMEDGSVMLVAGMEDGERMVAAGMAADGTAELLPKMQGGAAAPPHFVARETPTL